MDGRRVHRNKADWRESPWGDGEERVDVGLELVGRMDGRKVYKSKGVWREKPVWFPFCFTLKKNSSNLKVLRLPSLPFISSFRHTIFGREKRRCQHAHKIGALRVDRLGSIG